MAPRAIDGLVAGADHPHDRRFEDIGRIAM